MSSSSVLEVVLLNTEDWLMIGKVGQLCHGLRRAICERYPDLYDTDRALASRRSGKCIICGEKSKFNRALNCVIHPNKCLPRYVKNEAFLPSDPWLPKWTHLAPNGEFQSRGGRPRPRMKLTYWDKDDGIIARSRTTSFILMARRADFKEREAKYKDHEEASKAAKKAQQAEKRRLTQRKPAEWTALPLAERRRRALDERVRDAAGVIGQKYLAKLRRDGDSDLQPPSPTLASVLDTVKALATRAGYPSSDLESYLGDHFALVINPKTSAASLKLLLSQCASTIRQPRLDRERQARDDELQRQLEAQQRREEQQRSREERLRQEQLRQEQLRLVEWRRNEPQRSLQEKQCLIQQEQRRQERMDSEARRRRQDRLELLVRANPPLGEPQLPCPCGKLTAFHCPYVLCGTCCTSRTCPRHNPFAFLPSLPGPHVTNVPPAQPGTDCNSQP